MKYGVEAKRRGHIEVERGEVVNLFLVHGHTKNELLYHPQWTN